MLQSKLESTPRPRPRGRDGKGALKGQSGVWLGVEETEVVLEQGGVVPGGHWLSLVHGKFMSGS